MNHESGQSLVEVIVAATVGILVVSALTFATIFSLRNASFAKNSAQATKLAQEGIEKVRTIRDRDGKISYTGGNISVSKFSDLYDASLSFNCPSNCYFYFNAASMLAGGTNVNLEPILPGFQRQFLIEDEGSGQKRITVVVQWTDFAGPHESRLTTILRKL